MEPWPGSIFFVYVTWAPAPVPPPALAHSLGFPGSEGCCGALTSPLSRGWIGLSAICNLPKGPGGTHWLLLRSINSNGNQLSAPARRPGPQGTPPRPRPDCHEGASRRPGMGISGQPPNPAPGMPRRGPPPYCQPSPSCRGGFWGWGRRQDHLGRCAVWPEASSLPGVGNSPPTPGKGNPVSLTTNPCPLPRRPCFHCPTPRMEMRSPLVGAH